MSELLVTSIYNQEGEGAPSFPKGATVTGVITATSFSGSGANLTGIDATALKDGSGNVKIQANSTGAVVTGILTVSSSVSVGGTLTYEDVTNIDSVGLITARNGVNVSSGDIDVTSGNVKVGTAITAYGSTGIISATSYRGDGSQLSGIEAAPTVQLVADGSISAEEAVVAKGGKASAVTQYTSATGARQTVIGSSGVSISGGYIANRPISTAWDSSTNRVLALYKNNSSTKPAYIVGTVNDSTNSITWGTASDFSVSGAGNLAGSCNIAEDKFFVMFRDDNALKAVIMTTTSSNTASFGTIVQVCANSTINTYNYQCHFNPSTGNVIMAYCDDDAIVGGALVGNYASISGNTITVGTHANIFTYTPSILVDSVFDPIRNDVLVAWSSGHTGEKIYTRAIIEPTSGTQTVLGTQSTQANSIDTTRSGSASLGFDFDNDVFHTMWVKQQNNYGYYNYTDGSYDTAVNMPIWFDDSPYKKDLSPNGTHGNSLDSTSSGVFQMTYSSQLKKYIVIQKKGANAWFFTCSTKADGMLNFDLNWTQFITASDYDYLGRPIILNCGILIPYVAGGSFYTYIKRFDGTDVTSGNFIGFSKAAYTDGQTATVKVVGNVSTQSGLTPGKKYYVQNDGSVGQSAGLTSVPAGISLTATSLLIQPS